MDVVVRRNIDFLILIPTPLVSVLFTAASLLFHLKKKCFSFFNNYISIKILQQRYSILIIILVPLSLTSCYICGTCILCPALYPPTLGLWIVVRMLCKLYYMCCIIYVVISVVGCQTRLECTRLWYA